MLEEIPVPSEYPITAYELSSEKAGTSHYQNQDTTTNNQWIHSKLATPTLCFRHVLAWHSVSSTAVMLGQMAQFTEAKQYLFP